jgi:two-component system, OmpR family, response regulator
VHPEQASRILLVEDEPVAVKALVRLFSGCGFQTTIATSLAEARRIFSCWSENACAYAFIDNKLGDGFGIELLPELRLLRPAPAVALVSNWMTSDLAARAFREGAVPMAKPEDGQTMRDLISLLDARRDHAAAPEKAGGSPRDPAGLGEAPVRFGSFVLGDRELSTPTGRVQLRRRERAILAFLVQRGGRAASPLQIASEVLARSDDGAVRSVYSHVTNLRAALGAYAALVETVPGAGGYRLALGIFER